MTPNKYIILFLVNFIFFPFLVAQNKTLTQDEIYTLLSKADSLMFENNYKQSIKLSEKALKQALKINDHRLTALAYNSIAGVLEEIQEEDRALTFYKKAIFHISKSQNDTLKTWFYNNIGNVYQYTKKDPKLAYENYAKSLYYAEKFKDTASIVMTKLNLTWYYFNEKKSLEAIKHLDFAEKNIDQMRYPDIEVFLNTLLGNKFKFLKDYSKADFYYKKAIEISEENEVVSNMADSYKTYADYLFEVKDFENAYHYLDKHLLAKDKFLSLEKVKNTEIGVMSIELKEKDREISKIQNERQLQSDNYKKSKIIVILFMIFIFIMSLLLYTMYRNNQFKKRINDHLSKKNEELEEAKKKAEEASKLKTQFISTISHELRTPLYGVVGITNMLSDEHKELANSPLVSSLKFSARYLLSLVNDLLQINKIEEQKVVLENLTFNITDEIETVASSLSFIAERNGNQVIVDVDPNIPEYLIGDKLRLSQILMNLTSNALKFTSKGKVYISVFLEKKNGNSCYLNFKIQDTGIGISENDLEKIFDKFVQIDRKEDDYQGAGLGLSIVKKLIELFNSDITVTSKENEGTAFTFTIAFESDEAKVREIINNIHVDLSNTPHYKVLIVEDNKINQLVTKKIMDKSNYECVIVDNGYAAIDILEKQHFDVILMDINMPLINGFDTTRKIRKNGIIIPIIALTAFAKDEVTDEALASGMNDILIKPFEGIKLFQMIENLVKDSKRN